MKLTPIGLTLLIVLQSTFLSSGVFAQSSNWKPGDPVNLGHVHKPYTGEDESNSSLYTPPASQSSSVSASDFKGHTKKDRSKRAGQPVQTPDSSSATAHTPSKLRNAFRGIGNVIQREGKAWMDNPSNGSFGNASGAPMSGASSSSSDGLTGVSKMMAPPSGYGSGSNSTTNSPRKYSPGSNPATNFFLRP
ncbi:hypothetical protein BH10CYA1_BH10CYA1_54530 [soil metagenome]